MIAIGGRVGSDSQDSRPKVSGSRLTVVNNAAETFTSTASGAIATYIYETSRALQRDGISCQVISRDSQLPPFTYEPLTLLPGLPSEPQGRRSLARIEKKLLGWRYPFERRWLSTLEREIANLDEDIPIILHNDPEVAVALALRHRRRNVLHVHHNQLSMTPLFARLLRLSNITSVAVSNFTAEWLKNAYGLPDVQVVNPGVNSSMFQPDSSQARSEGAPLITFAGRTGREKGLDLLLKAALLISESVEFRVGIVGSNHWGRFTHDSYQSELSRLIAQLQERGVPVIAHGHLPRSAVPSALSRSAIHVVPSRWDEPFGLTALEGMACAAVPVVARVGGLCDVVGSTGFTFPRNDSKALSDRLLALLVDPQLRTELGLQARRRAVTTFSWESTARGLLQAVA